MSDNTYNKVKKFIDEHHMIEAGDLVAAGVSGGADSVCLLHLLWRLQQEIPYRFIAVHVNHMIRADAAKDAAFVERLCERFGIPYFLKEVDMSGYAKEQKLSSEEAGRILRYQAFEEVLDGQGDKEACKIAVAHNANDRAETMLFHIFRGSGMKGVCSIQPVRETVIRPILCLERQEIEAYLEKQGIDYCTDSTNEEDAYTRNKIRHHILPYAEQEICQGAVAHMSELADILSETEDYLAEQTRRLYQICADEYKDSRMTENGQHMPVYGLQIQGDRLLPEHPVMIGRVLLYCLEQMIPHRKDITGRHIADLTALMQKEGSKELSLPCGVRAYKEYDRLYLVREEITDKEEVAARDGVTISEDFSMAGQAQRSGKVYEIKPPMTILITGTGDFTFTIYEQDSDVYKRIFNEKQQNIPENRYTKWFDYDKITTAPSLRTRRQGDYLTIDTFLHTKSVKQYMINEKIPKMQRDHMYLLADGAHIMWIPGYRISQYYKVDESTKRILQVCLRGGRNGRTN